MDVLREHVVLRLGVYVRRWLKSMVLRLRGAGQLIDKSQMQPCQRYGAGSLEEKRLQYRAMGRAFGYTRCYK